MIDVSGGPDQVPLDRGLAATVRDAGADLAGSLYALPPPARPYGARLLHRHGLWIHADVFADDGEGVGTDLIADLAAADTGPLDVHLLTAGSLRALETVCRAGVDRITFAAEGVDDPAGVASRIRGAGASPWLAIAPATSLEDCAAALAQVDGVLVMLLPPGTRQAADLGQLGKVETVRTRHVAGVDGGVDVAGLPRILAAGTRYVVAGRSLFTDPTGGR